MSSRVEISKRLVLVNTASGIAARVINISVLVWLHQYLLRRISPEEYQLLPVLTGIILLLPLLTTVLTAGLGRFVVAAYARGDERDITQIVSTMFPLLLVVGSILLAGGLAFSWYVDRILSIPPDRVWDARIMMALLMLSVGTRPPCAAFTVGLFVRQKFVLHNFLKVIDEMLRLVLLFILLFGVSTRVLWVVVANVTAEISMTIVLVVVSRRLIPALRFRRGEIRWERAREIVSFGGWNFLGYLAWRLRLTVIPLILNRLATPMDVNMYYIGSLPRRQIELWGDVLATPLSPVVTGMHAMGAKERVRSVYMRGGRISLWVTLMAALPAIIYSRTLIRLYIGNEFMDAAVVIAFTLACLPITNGAWMIWHVANATGRIRALGIRALVIQLLVIGVTFYLVREHGWGAVGAAFASFGIGVVTTAITLWPLGLKLANVEFATWVRQTLVPGLAPGCVAAVAWVALDLVAKPDSWIGLSLCTGLGILCYTGMLLGFCLEPRDKKDLATILTGIRSRIRSSSFIGGKWPACPEALTFSGSEVPPPTSEMHQGNSPGQGVQKSER